MWIQFKSGPWQPRAPSITLVMMKFECAAFAMNKLTSELQARTVFRSGRADHRVHVLAAIRRRRRNEIYFHIFPFPMLSGDGAGRVGDGILNDSHQFMGKIKRRNEELEARVRFRHREDENSVDEMNNSTPSTNF